MATLNSISTNRAPGMVKMVASVIVLSIATSYWLTPAQGTKHPVQSLEGATTLHPQDNRNPRNDNGEDENNKFNTFWPMVMMLITAIIFIIIIVIVCKRFCRNNGRPDWGRRNRSHSLDSAETRARHRRPSNQRPRDETSRSVDDSIWSINIPDTDMPSVFGQMKPPPYCDKPPAYDDVSANDLPKYALDNMAFSMDRSLYEIGESTRDSATSSAYTTPAPVSHVQRTGQSSATPNEPPPVYQVEDSTLAGTSPGTRNTTNPEQSETASLSDRSRVQGDNPSTEELCVDVL